MAPLRHAAALAALIGANMVAAKPCRIGFYVGEGTSSDLLPFISTLRAGAAQAFPAAVVRSGFDGYTLTNMSAADVGMLSAETYDVVVFPGGSGNGQATAVGENGLAALRSFVDGGNGYIGTCGGAFLGLQHAQFYGPGPAGRGPPTEEPFNRGHGNVLVEFTQAGLEELSLPPQKYSGNVTIMYWQVRYQQKTGCFRVHF